MATREALETMVAEADIGGRKPTGLSKTYIVAVSLAWSVFQLWYASPLPNKLNFGVIADGQARIVHLIFAFLLAFAAFPALRSSPRYRIPAIDWVLSMLGTGAAVSAGFLPGYFAPSGITDTAGRRRFGRWCGLIAGSRQARRWARARSDRKLDARLHFCRSLASGHDGT